MQAGLISLGVDRSPPSSAWKAKIADVFRLGELRDMLVGAYY